MNLNFNSYSFVLLVSGLLTLLLAIFLFTRNNKASKWFGLNMVFTSWWAITYGFELSSTSLNDMLASVKLQYIGITMLPVTWIGFVISFTGKDKWFKTKNVLLLLLVPVLTLLIVCTNTSHHLYYRSVAVDHSGAFPMLEVKPAIWYRFFTVYFYLNLAAGIYILLTAFKKQGWIYRRQKVIILVAAVIPWVANLLYIFGYRPQQHLDITPYAFITSDLLVCFGLLKLNLFDIIPVAREKIVEALRDGVLVLDVFDRIIDINGRMKKVLSNGYSGEILSLNINEVFKDEIRLHEVLSQHKDSKIELTRLVDNEERFFEVDVSFLYEKNKEFAGAIILFRDITERKKAEQKLGEQATQLQELNQLKDRLFSIIAHDLRGPIMNLKLLVNMIDTGMITDMEFKSFVPELSKKLGYTSGLLENLLYWSKTQLEGQKLDTVKFDLSAVIENEIHYSFAKAQEKGISIINNIDSSKSVYADKHMIELVVRNILSNAVKFSGKGDTITIVSNEAKDDQVLVCISDTGVGMKPESLEKLFSGETFTTLGTNKEKGTGLGLQLCKDFIEKNNGRIWAESKEGDGSSICFTIPVGVIELATEEVGIR